MSNRIDRSSNARPTPLTPADVARQWRALEKLEAQRRTAARWKLAQRIASVLLGLGIAAMLFYRF